MASKVEGLWRSTTSTNAYLVLRPGRGSFLTLAMTAHFASEFERIKRPYYHLYKERGTLELGFKLSQSMRKTL